MHSEVTIYPHAMDLSLCRAYYKLPSATVTPSLESILDSLQPAKKRLPQMYQLSTGPYFTNRSFQQLK